MWLTPSPYQYIINSKGTETNQPNQKVIIMKLSPNQLEAKRLREIANDIRFAANMADYRSNAASEYELAKKYEAEANILDPEGIAKPEPKKWNGYM